MENEKNYINGYNKCLNDILKHIESYKFTPQGVDEILTDICKKILSMKKEKENEV